MSVSQTIKMIKFYQNDNHPIKMIACNNSVIFTLSS
jgi:hypothetical protein